MQTALAGRSRAHRPRTGPPGFTLVELLVVIGIIALLIAILMPALSKARAQANAVKCASQMREIGKYFVHYAMENKGNIFPCDANGKHFGGAYPVAQRWPTLVFKDQNLATYNNYVPDLMRCPVDDRGVLDSSGGFHSYNINGALFMEGAANLPKWWRMGGKVKDFEISDVVFMAEKQNHKGEWHIDLYPTNSDSTMKQWYDILMGCPNPTDPNLKTGAYPSNNQPKYKHGKMGMNFLYLDWSVRNEEPKVRFTYQLAPHHYERN